MSNSQNTTSAPTLKVQPIAVIWTVTSGDTGYTVTVHPDGESECTCADFRDARALWGEGACPHTRAVRDERRRRGLVH